MKLFEVDEHPRVPKGLPKGGQFKDKIFKAVKEAPEPVFGDYPPKKGDSAYEHLGNTKDTQDLYGYFNKKSKRYEYVKSRKPVHDKIVEEALAGAPTGGSEPPRLVFLAGGPASGKSSLLGMLTDKPDSFVHVDVDEIKEGLPEYQGMVEDGEPYAAAGVHEESVDIGKRITWEAMERRLDIVIDGTGNGKEGDTTSKLERFAQAGYDVKVVMTSCPTELAEQRSLQRAKDTGRFVPLRTVRQLHRSVSRRFPEIFTWAENLDLWDTSENPPKLVLTRRGEEITPIDKEAVAAFLDKANEEI